MTVYGSKQQTFEDYEGFVDKFKPKKTTDDCYTPPRIYEAVKEWAISEYGLEGREIVRPFYPGGDYEMYDYPENCVVIDNPPFSIISEICRNYSNWGVDYFLFAPTLTNFGIKSANHVIVGIGVIYDNGADVNTSFVTSFGDKKARTAPALYQKIDSIQEEARAEKALPVYVYPDELLTANDLVKLNRGGVEFGIENGITVSALDEQKSQGRGVFGQGLLIKHADAERKRAALERAEVNRAKLKRETIPTHQYHLTDRERELIKRIK